MVMDIGAEIEMEILGRACWSLVGTGGQDTVASRSTEPFPVEYLFAATASERDAEKAPK